MGSSLFLRSLALLALLDASVPDIRSLVMPTLRAGILLFPKLTQLDATGPYEVLSSRARGAEVDLVAPSLDPVVSEHGMAIMPTVTMANAPSFDLVCIPGGPASARS